ncbi:MAG: hypothetical protein KGI58_02115 [Patescibacteria group bacterium]|nr:hypothetical protein [Patescibacteria group bacterium]
MNTLKIKKLSSVRVADKKKLIREQNHLTRPPRLDGKVKDMMVQPTHKQPKIKK